MAQKLKCGAAIALVAVLGGAGTVFAQDSQSGRGLAAACFTCHGTDGRSVGGQPPGLAGQNKDYLVQTMKDFRDGKRPATIMHQISKGYTDAQIELMGSYFAGVKPGAGAAAPAGN